MDKEKEKLEQEKAEAWLAGQRLSKRKFNPSAYEKYWQKIEKEEKSEEKNNE